MNQAYFLMVMKKNLINRPKTDDGDGLVVVVFGVPGSTPTPFSIFKNLLI